MELFSKRYNVGTLKRYRYIRRPEGADNDFLNELTRKRLQEEIKYVVSSNEYIESFLIVEDKERDIYNLNHETLTDLSQRELGYDISEIYNFKSLNFDTEQYSDIKFFDLIELLFIFSYKEKRKNFIQRVERIFKEDGTGYVVHDSMIYDKNLQGLRSIIPLIKDKLLKDKLESIYGIPSIAFPGSSGEIKARNSADILQFIFSSPKNSKSTLKYAQGICDDVSSKWTNSEHKKELSQLLSDTVKNVKLLNNQISNVRHTDQNRIPVDSPSFYKMIAAKNLAIVELVILSLPEKYIAENDPEILKEKYEKEYQIDLDTKWIIEKKPEINLEDVPF